MKEEERKRRQAQLAMMDRWLLGHKTWSWPLAIFGALALFALAEILKCAAHGLFVWLSR